MTQKNTQLNTTQLKGSVQKRHNFGFLSFEKTRLKIFKHFREMQQLYRSSYIKKIIPFYRKLWIRLDWYFWL